ncbi:MAG: MarR family transcriptional regulator [Lachnospiraceae bacterium]|nr:MarR family transcriptional regulator [Lachnospiraceae bacterium]
MEDTALSEVFQQFRVSYYRDVFRKIKTRELSLTTVEVFCVEIIAALKNPTINEFASFIGISSPNAAYKINSLIQKGYIEKVQSDTDKREYYLTVTDKFYEYYAISERYLLLAEKRLKETLSPEDYTTFNRILNQISEEIMPELTAEREQ